MGGGLLSTITLHVLYRIQFSSQENISPDLYMNGTESKIDILGYIGVYWGQKVTKRAFRIMLLRG